MVELRGPDDEVLGTVPDPRFLLADATRSQFSECRLLRYLVPWGDTMFNQAQAEDLAADLRLVLAKHSGGPLGHILNSIQPLVDRLAGDPNHYLWFLGD